jgi:anaerobic glycerol-3-phosphate dehydrogenase
LQENALRAATAEEVVIVEATTEADAAAHLAEADLLTEEVAVAETEVTVVRMEEPRSSAKVFVSSASKRVTSRGTVPSLTTIVVDLDMREEMMIEVHAATEITQGLQPVQEEKEADATLPLPEDGTLPREIEGRPETTLGQDLLQDAETRP